MMSDTKTTSGKRWPVWAFFPVGLLAVLLTIQAVMVSLATNDPAFAVEDDYYQRAVEWDTHAAQREKNHQLGWSVGWTVTAQSEASGRLALQLKHPDGSPVTNAKLQLVAFPNVRSSQRQTLSARELSPGQYVAIFDLSRPGLWEFRLAAHAAGHTFTEVTQLDVPRGAQTGSPTSASGLPPAR